MCSLKKHPCWCLSPVFISGAPQQFRNKVCRAQSVWLLLATAQVSLLNWAQLWCPWCRMGREHRAKAVPEFARVWHLFRRGGYQKEGFDEWVLCLPRSLCWWDCGASLLFSLKENFLLWREKYCAVESTKRAEEWSFLNQIIFNDNADRSDCFKSGTNQRMAWEVP